MVLLSLTSMASTVLSLVVLYLSAHCYLLSFCSSFSLLSLTSMASLSFCPSLSSIFVPVVPNKHGLCRSVPCCPLSFCTIVLNLSAFCYSLSFCSFVYLFPPTSMASTVLPFAVLCVSFVVLHLSVLVPLTADGRGARLPERGRPWRCADHPSVPRGMRQSVERQLRRLHGQECPSSGR